LFARVGLFANEVADEVRAFRHHHGGDMTLAA